MISESPRDRTAVLTSGGLDSSILLAHLAAEGIRVQPLYVCCRLRWETAELAAIRRFLAAIDLPNVAELVTLEMPLEDVYQADHWSRNGRHVPAAGTADEAVLLPGRNPLLLVKAMVWCQLHDYPRLATAALGSNPFADSTDAFYESFEESLALALGRRISIERPFARLDKRRVMELGRNWPLELTFSCIQPVDGLHCGRCNKCAERQSAFDHATARKSRSR